MYADNIDLQRKAYELRKNAVDIIMAGRGGHIGGDMSVMEILITLYFKEMNISATLTNDDNRDRFVLSKGHAVEAYYSVLSECGFLDLDDIKKNFMQFNSPYIGHPNNKLNGIEMNSGSLGHGLPVCIGMALAAKMDKRPYRVYTVMGDGELAEGSVWEAAMAASHYRLDNLCVTIDRNGLQISGNTEDVMGHENLADRFKSFGWNVIDVRNGNDIEQLTEAYHIARQVKKRPSVVIAHTVKGCGSKVMEGKKEWHHKLPSEDEYNQIIKDFIQHEGE